MDHEILNRYVNNRNIPWQTADIDLFNQHYNGNSIPTLYQGSLLEPPPAALRNNSPAYDSSLLNKSRCPPPNTMTGRLGQPQYDTVDDHIINQMGMIGGFRPFLRRYHGCIMLMPGNMVDNTSFLTHPHHFDKQALKAGMMARLWSFILAIYFFFANAIFRRGRRMMQRALAIRVYLQSPGYAQTAAAESDSGLHAYANCNMIRAYIFHLTHRDRYRLHLPGNDQEYGRSLWFQVLASHDLRMVHAIGMDSTNHPDNKYLSKWDVLIPVISSFHGSNGPASHPILGSIMTSSEDFYRPTLRPLQFRYAIRKSKSK